MSQDPHGTVLGWIQGFQDGDPNAAADLWQSYFQRVVQAARRRLADVPQRVVDEEDVALSVLRCLCDGAAQGRFDRLENHDDLWRLLLTMTRQKCVDYIRAETREKRGGGKVRGESLFESTSGSVSGGLDALVGENPSAEYAAQMGELFKRLLSALPDQVPKQLVLWRMEGWTVDEIAAKLDISSHAVRRKLRLIRTLWRESLETK